MTTLATILGRGLLSARPAAGIAGALYYATDNGNLYRDNGSTWDALTVVPFAHGASHAPNGSDDLYFLGGHTPPATIETFPRLLHGSSYTLTSGGVHLTMFTAPITLTASNITFVTSGTQTAAACTLCRFGLYTVDGSGNSTLVAATANDTTLLAAQLTSYTKALSLAGDLVTAQPTYTLVRGNRYALALIWVGTTPPTINRVNVTTTPIIALSPVMNGQRTGQADLPASNTTAQAPASTGMLYGYLT